MSKRKTDLSAEVQYRTARAHLRKHTVENFSRFTFQYHGETKLIMLDDILLKQVVCARLLGVPTVHLSDAWREYCIVKYGEPRRWPGPDTKYYRKYLRKDDPNVSYTQMRQEISERRGGTVIARASDRRTDVDTAPLIDCVENTSDCEAY